MLSYTPHIYLEEYIPDHKRPRLTTYQDSLTKILAGEQALAL